MRRLEAVLALLPHTRILADVGCDHGKLCYEALTRGLAEQVYACDVSAPSLEKARILLKDFSGASFFHTDGLNGVPDDFTALCLCGMGAALMLRITENYVKDAVVVLQPQNHAEQVRREMLQRGFRLDEELLAYERGKYYPVMRFVRGEGRLRPLQIRFGLHAEHPTRELVAMCRQWKEKWTNYPLTSEKKSVLDDIEEVLQHAGNGF